MKTGKFKVLQVVEATYGGVGRHVLDLCGTLIERGHEVHLLYSSRRMEPDFQRRLTSMGGLHRHEVPMRRSPQPHDLVALARLVSYGKTHGPFSIIHGHSSKAGALGRLAAKILGRPSIYTPNAFRTSDPALGRLAFAFYAQIERWLAMFGSEIIAVSLDERDHAVTIGLDERHLHVVHNGVAADRTPEETVTRASLSLPEDAIVAGFVGRLTHQKAPERLLEAAARLSLPSLHWVLVGDGPDREKLRAMSRALGIDHRVHWLGRRDGFSIMPAFDLLVLPSRYEGMPYVLIEALIHSLPIVASDAGGSRDAVNHGVNGFVVPEGNIDALTEAVGKLVRDKSLRLSMSHHARNRAAEFSLSRMVDQTLKVYASAYESFR